MHEVQGPYTIHVVSHTHWDREWRYPFQEFRMLLVDMFDALIKLLQERPDYKYFLLDSQTIPLEDYLAIKPENEPILRRLVEEGRIQIGPWYTLPDTPEISGESIVRNLLMGTLITEEWKGKKWSGYSPFSFGQSSQMPQIYRGFDLDHMFFYRGNNDRITKHEFIWEAPDGSRIMGMRSVNPYGRANWYVHVYRPVALNKWPFEWDYHWREGQLPFHPCDEELYGFDYWLLEGKHLEKLYLENLPKALAEIKAHAVKGATCDQLLYLDGMDQVNPYPRTPEIIAEANKLNTGDTYIHSSFYDYVEAVKARAKDLKVMRGEFRYTMVDGLWQNLFPGMLCARMYLKQQNRACELKLQKNADTWAALANLVGMEYPEGMLRLAWKYHLANQSHDSIAGCSVDLVHEDVEYRNRQIRHLADNVTRRSMAHIVRNIDNKRLPEDAVCLIAFNPTQYQRSEVVNAIIDLPEESGAKWFTVEDETGNQLPVQFIRSYPFGPIVKNPYEFPIPYKARRVHCAIGLNDVPGLGYRSFVIKPQPGRKLNYGSLSPAPNVMENEHLRAEIGPDGRVDLVCKSSGVRYRGLHYFLDFSDVGDHATQRRADMDEEISSIGAQAEIGKVVDGPVMVQYRVKLTMMLPKDALADGSRRNPERVPFEIVSYLTLKSGAPMLEVHTELTNNVRDHKLLVMFPSGYSRAERSYSETHFDVTERDIHLPDTSTWKEPMLPYYPQYMFCGVQGEGHGLAILNVGLPEYAVFEDEQRTIGLTLVRTYRFPIIGADPENVATDETQVMCQCLRPFTFDYAVYPYQGVWHEGGVYEYANRFNLKLRLVQAGRSTGELPPSLSFIDIQPGTLVLSAVKRSSRSDGLIVRVFNPTEETVDGSISFWRPVREARLVKLNEKPIGPARCEGRSVFLRADKNKIVTLEVWLD
ncbi:MAG: glycosyl hydrolase-related protein [candidate division KSB1 bacterium]|nr:glycosyl hydrolase-related protein [candidate division KSB1 bacterium]MDZ7378820.1 glycosyl hydrolase-related protein [candidate division KSB1 bacterium]MDZ7392073.1 glycosyl hydrolase-related protein [candidate division KSB1 bacterium]MDZ7411952.1 glycosyl hydrolase-related protein [candidate division KSB1 bacterium]